MKRKEVVEKRTENSKLYENQDHSFTREIFLEAVHYEDADGRWKEKEALECCLAGQGDDSALVSLSKDGCMLSWGVQGAAHAVGKKTEAGTLYPEIFGDVDMRCQTLGEKVKEDFILRSARAARSFTYLYHMKGLKAVQDGDYVAFLNEKGDEVFTVCAPYMQDAAGSRSDEIRLLFTQEDDAHCKISFEADEKWLDAPDRCFPVVLDPVTTTSKKAKDIMDAHVDSKHEEDNFQTNMFLKTMGGDNIQRSFVKFVLPEISTGDMVLNARLVLVSLTTDGKERTVNVHRVMQDWDSSTINWYNKPVYEETVQDSCRYTADKQKYITLDITRLVKDWYQNGKNFGLMFKDDYELSGYTSFLSSDCDSGYQDMRPRIDITYANYSGLEDFWNYHSQDAGRAGTVHVNDFNGNLILERTDFAMGGSLMPVSLKHVYNSNNRKENLGYGLGFRLNYHQTLKKVTIAGTDYYQHVDGDGTVHYFYYDSSKKTWKDEFGLEFTLTVNSGTAEPYVIRDKEDNLLVFDSNGYLIKVRDKNSNTLAITYSNSRIAKITDGAGRVTSFTYLKDANGTATDLSQITMPSGQTIAFAYTSHMLTSVTDMDGTVTKYTFASNGNLSSVVNADGYQLKYGYYGTAPYRVKSIAEYGGATAGNTLTLTYGYNSTKFTDSKGRSEIYRFDNSCNLLHIHDGFGHAASGKYTKDGKHVNRLENATKLQSNIVQLLKDPIIQAKTIGWTPKVYAEGTGTTSVNTDTKYCMVGNRSLKAECTAQTSYAYWAQNVTVKKGETYTASMYVKAAVTSAAEDGGCLLRVRYLDKDGTQHLLDSEVLKKTTTDFVRLKRTFTIPADAGSDSIKIYMVVWHAVGTMYGDMAQLETGTTANRCNLVDNGEFHRGSTSGFSKTGDTEDCLVKLGENSFIPMQEALMATAAGVIYNLPSTSGTQVASVVKNQHLAGYARYTDTDGKKWHHVKNASGQWGYILSSSVTPYLGGSSCNATAVVGVTGAVLRASASDTGTPVQEAIPKGTSLAIGAKQKDSGGKTWYYVGMQIDETRYCGYISADYVIRIYWNYVYGKMSAADSCYEKPSKSSTVRGSVKSGETVAVNGVMEKNNGEIWYAVLKGKEYAFLPQANFTMSNKGYYGMLSTAKVTESIGGLEEHIYKFLGNPEKNKKLTKTLDIQGAAGDTYMVNAWGRGTALPETSNDTARRFGVEVVFVCTDGTNDTHYTNFSPDILDWQFLSDIYVAKKAYSSIRISYTYCHNANIAFFDGLSLFREEFGQSYTYDDKNNVISVVDAKKQASKFEYNSTNDLTGVTDAKGNKFTYEYDKKHNPVKGTSAQGMVYSLEYDDKGNVKKSGCVDPAETSRGIWLDKAMTTSRNYTASVTDARNNTVKYTWNESRDQLTAVTDARGNKLSYGYDSANRLSSVSHDVTQNGTKSTVKNTYTYTKDRLTGISHNGFSYGFAYDAFGNLTGESAAGKQIIGYEYEAANGNLLKTTYANGDYVRFTYDGQDRVLLSYYKPASGSEQKLNEYVYDRSGNLAKVTSHMTGKSYEFDYDFLDRLMRARDNADNYYEYTYDVNNNMTRMYHGAGVYGIATTYSYDKDGRETTASASKNYYRTTEYDPLGRIANQLWHTPAAISGAIYEYSGSGTRENGLPSSMQVGGSNYGYTYDQNGNITQYQVSDTNASGGTTKTVTYQYDELNRLIRENNQILNKTVTYAYDIGGNLVSEKEYAYASGTLPASASVTKTGTFDSVWKDKLIKWNGVAMTYDASGNMLTKGSTRYTWTLGNALAAVSNGKNIQYSYDYAGHRIRKVVDGAVTQMCYAGDLLASERTGSEKTLWYRYDSSGNVIALTYESEIYMYLRNAQNDIIGLLDKDGKAVVRYTYDSWGQVVKIEGTLKDKVGARNPFRYKGYYYDVETGLYYCRSRYYDPAIRRFISADDTQVLRNNLDMLGEKNLYAYCDDNPITRVDGDGQCWNILAGAVIGAAMNVLAGGVAAAVTGQEYTAGDMIAAAIAGGIAGGFGSANKAILKIVGAIGGGIFSAIYAGQYSYKREDSLLAIISNASTAFFATTFISNLTGFALSATGFENTIAVTWGATYGVGASSIAASVSLGVSSSASQKRTQEQHVYWEKKIGQGRYFDGRTGTSVNYNIWKSSAGTLKKRPKRTYRPSNAYSV